MPDVKYCHNCGAQNKEHFAFCKMCGTDITELPKPTAVKLDNAQALGVAPLSNGTSDTPFVKTAYVPAGQDPVAKPEESATLEEATLYVGDDSEALLRKYNRYTKRKSVWNWPVFFFSLLGIPFVWFFYRRMYKTGAIILAVWLVLTCGSSFFKYHTYQSASEGIVSFAESSIDAVKEGFNQVSNPNRNKTINDKINKKWTKTVNALMANEVFLTDFTVTVILELLKFACVIILPIFANKLYFAKLNKDIKRIKSNNTGDDAIKLSGGKSITTALTVGFSCGAVLGIISLLPLSFILYDMSNEFVKLAFDLLSHFGIKFRIK